MEMMKWFIFCALREPGKSVSFCGRRKWQWTSTAGHGTVRMRSQDPLVAPNQLGKNQDLKTGRGVFFELTYLIISTRKS